MVSRRSADGDPRHASSPTAASTGRATSRPSRNLHGLWRYSPPSGIARTTGATARATALRLSR